MYDPLHYVLLFPYGEDGWDEGLKKPHKPGNKTRDPKLTCQDYYTYRLAFRRDLLQR